MKNIFSILSDNYEFNRNAALFKDVPLENQDLWEDIIQITTKKAPDLCIDIGWYGGEVDEGYFRIVVIKDENWDEPICSKTTRSIGELEIFLKEFLTYLDT